MAGAASAALLSGGLAASVVSAATVTATYTYDTLGRLKSATYTNGTSVTYDYDKAGNRTQVVTVGVGNGPPDAMPDGVTTSLNTPLSFDPRLNDTDPNGDAITITGVTVPSPANGATAVITGSGTGITFTPATGVSGTSTFTYTLSDGTLTDTALVTVTITGANQAPVANADSKTVQLDTATVVSVLGNDTDADVGDVLSVSAITVAPGHGTAVISGAGNTQVTYTPTTSYTGTDSFTYQISDGQGHNATAVVSITVVAGNQAPVAGNDAFSTPVRTNYDFDPTTNDTDADGDTLTVTTKTNPSHGSVSIRPSNILRYRSSGSYTGSDSFTYTIDDGNGHTATATVNVTVGSVSNGAPTAVNDTKVTTEEVALTFNPLTNDTDPDSDALTISAATNGTHGSVTIGSGATSLTYSPDLGYTGSDSFTYTIDDGNGHTATATVSMTVNAPPVNQPPTAVNDTKSTPKNTAVNFDPRTNDTDAESDPFTITDATDGANGTVTVDGGGTSVTYTPALNYTGSDSFTYTINDGNGPATATVSMTVTVPNTAPDAVNDTKSTNSNTALAFDPRTNDTDAEANALTVTAVTQPAAGTGSVVKNGPGTQVTYTPPSNWIGSTSFTYTISDGALTDTATVSMTVNNQNPTAVTDTKTTPKNTALAFDPRTNDTDPESQTLTISSVVTAPSHGTAVKNGPGTQITYTPTTNYTGADSFTYAISDGNGGTSTGTVNFTVTNPNTAPNAVNDSKVAQKNTALAFDPRTNDTDPEGDTITVTAVTSPSHGTAVKNGGGTQITYTPTTNYVGTDSFTYTLSDGALTDTATVSMVVNGPPVATTDTKTTNKNTALAFDPRTNDTDPNGDSLTVTAVTSPSHGTAVKNGGGTQVTYTPTTNYTGADSFTYTLSDNNGATATGTVNFTVTAPGPTAVNDSLPAHSVLILSSWTYPLGGMNVVANDTSPNGYTLTVTGVTNGTKGNVTFTSTNVSYIGTQMGPYTDSFTYTISDGNGGTATGTVTVTAYAPGS
jgi:YD repeat-containing protein